jgi:hypothetical protein
LIWASIAASVAGPLSPENPAARPPPHPPTSHRTRNQPPTGGRPTRVHVRYADGSVSVERTSWDFLGYLQDYKDQDHPDDETVSIALILSRLKDPDTSRHP